VGVRRGSMMTLTLGYLTNLLGGSQTARAMSTLRHLDSVDDERISDFNLLRRSFLRCIFFEGVGEGSLTCINDDLEKNLAASLLTYLFGGS